MNTKYPMQGLGPIETDVPVPARHSRVSNLPFATMSVGESIRVDLSEGEYRKLLVRLFAMAVRRKKKFTTRWLGDHGRIWRIE